MVKRSEKLVSFLLSVLMIISILVSGNTAMAVDSSEAENGGVAANQPAQGKLLKIEKKASDLDKNLETKVSLSFPGKQEVLPADIVFVLDKSGASAQDDIYNQAKSFLEDIKKQAEDKGLNIKVGVVLFNMKGNIKQGLTDLVSGYDDILKAMNSSVSMGTNMHAGLLAAKKILDDDSEVKKENKHVILISDGATYLYCNNGDYTKAYTRSFGDPKKQTNPNTNQPYLYGADRKGGIWESQSREYNTPNDFKKFDDGTNFIFSQAMTKPEKLGKYLDYYRTQDKDTAKNWAQYEYEYNFGSAYFNSGRKTTPIDVNAPANIDIAFMKTDDTFQEMVKAGYNMNVYFKNAADFDGTVFLEYMTRNSNGGELNKDFDKLKKSVLDKISKGSTVEDIVGKDFDFVNDMSKISLKVGDQELAKEKIDANSYGFGKTDDGTYRFKLTYKSGQEEKLTLDINETIYPAKPVTLEFSEKLVKVPTEPGTHILKTNEEATLNPVDGNKKPGEKYVFPVPELTYEVATPNNPTKPTETEVIGGDDRIDTADKISKKYYSYADHVIIARKDEFPDALTASVLAKALDAPILLTDPNKLDERVAAELKRLGVKKAYVIGRERAISEYTEAEIRKITGSTERIGGIDRFETSSLVAKKVVSIVGKKGRAVIATGEKFADSLSISPYAAKMGYPILLVKHNKVPEIISKAIKDLSINEVYIVGGDSAVSIKLEKELPKLIKRIGGIDRYETSAKIADEFFTNSKRAFMASGQVFADALVIGPVAANENAPVLLTMKDKLPQPIKKVIDRVHYEKITIVGLENAVSKEVIDSIN